MIRLPVRYQMKPPSSRVETIAHAGCWPLSSHGVLRTRIPRTGTRRGRRGQVGVAHAFDLALSDRDHKASRAISRRVFRSTDATARTGGT
jgi:hypothetical protein